MRIMKMDKDGWFMWHNIKVCNEAVIIKIALSWNKGWQTNETFQMSRNRYTHIAI